MAKKTTMPDPIPPFPFGNKHTVRILREGEVNEVEVQGPIVVPNLEPREEFLNKLLDRIVDYLKSPNASDPNNSLSIELPFVNSGGQSLISYLDVSYMEKNFRLDDVVLTDKNTICIVLSRSENVDIRATSSVHRIKFDDDEITGIVKESILSGLKELLTKEADELTRRASARAGAAHNSDLSTILTREELKGGNDEAGEKRF